MDNESDIHRFEKISLGKRIRACHNLRLPSQHTSRLTDFGAKSVKIVSPVVKTRPLDVPRPLMHAPLPCAILVSPPLPQDQQRVRDSVRVLHTAVVLGFNQLDPGRI